MILLLLFPLIGSINKTVQTADYETDISTIRYTEQLADSVRPYRPISVLFNCLLYRIGI